MSGVIGLVTRDPSLALAVDAILRRSGREAAHRAASLEDLLRAPCARPLALALIDSRAGAAESSRPSVPEILIRIGAVGMSTRPCARTIDADLGGRPDLGALGRLLPAAIAGGLSVFAVRRPAPPGRLLVVGASTGGPEALVALFSALGAPASPALVAIHMPADGTAAFAAHLAARTGLRVVEAGPGRVPEAGTVALLRGGMDYGFARRSSGWHLVRAAEDRGPFRPSVDALVASAVAAGFAGDLAILSGMGRDGATSAALAGGAGWRVFVQRPDTCAVGGMPAAALAAYPPAIPLPPAAIGRRLAVGIAPLDGCA